jgi:hypothetical protein
MFAFQYPLVITEPYQPEDPPEADAPAQDVATVGPPFVYNDVTRRTISIRTDPHDHAELDEYIAIGVAQAALGAEQAAWTVYEVRPVTYERVEVTFEHI